MAGSIGVRGDFTASDLRGLARRFGDADQVRRLLALAAILAGASRSEAAKTGGVTLQIVRDWVLRFNAEGPDGLKSRKAPGKRSILNDAQRSALAEQVEAGRNRRIHSCEYRAAPPKGNEVIGCGKCRQRKAGMTEQRELNRKAKTVGVQSPRFNGIEIAPRQG